MNAKINRYERLIKNMNLPNERKRYSQSNALWFIRNGALLNRNHQNFQEAFDLARQLA
jgi:hypothetical protein